MQENYFYDLYHNAPVAYQSLNEDGNVIEVNSFWLNQLGYSDSEVRGKWFGDFLSEESRAHFKKNFPKFKERGHIRDVKFSMIAKDGSTVNVSFEGKISYTDDGQFNMTHCIFMKSGEHPTHVSDTFHQSVFEQTSIPMVVIDPELLTVKDVNQAACDLYQGSYRDIVSKNVIELTLEQFDKIEALQEQIRKGNISPFEALISDFNNNLKTVEVYPTVFNIAEKRYVSLVLVDITDEKKQEEKLLLKDKISNAFLSHDENIIFADISKVLRETFSSQFCYVGYIRPDGALVSPSLTVEIWDECRIANKNYIFPVETWGGAWGKSLKEKISFYQNEDLNVPLGHVKLDNAMAIVIVDNDKLLGQFVVANKKTGFSKSDLNMGLLIADTLRPILRFWLEDKNSRELLNEKKEELRRQLMTEMELTKKQEQILFEQKKFVDMGQMMSAIAHQWRQPLNNIHLVMYSIKQIHEGLDTGFTFKQLEKMHSDAVDFMSKTIDRFRDYLSKSSKDEEFSPASAILDTVNLISAQFLNQDISINLKCGEKEVDIEGDMNDMIFSPEDKMLLAKGDIGSFHQIMLNLLSNARDALLEYRAENPKQGVILLTVKPVEDKLKISVFNTGYPIKDDIMTKIFDPYFTTKEDGKGTGVGLYMTKMIVEDGFRGTIKAVNHEDGVEFIINIPRVTKNDK